MKEKILLFLKTDRSYAGAVKLYLEVGNLPSLKRMLNVSAETKLLKDTIFDQFRILIGYNDSQFKSLLALPLADAPAPPEKGKPIQEVSIEEQIKRIPKKELKSIRLREEFPFLASPDCQDELKVMVSDMLSAYDNYRKKHELLFTAENNTQVETFARETVEDYLENRAIWAELNHYKEKGELLGEYKRFEEKNELDAIDKLTTSELVKMNNNLMSNISKLEKKISGNPGNEKQSEWAEKLELSKKKLDRVKARLNL
jgi:hypothetical protein